MSIRFKIILTISFIVVLITASSMGISVWVGQSRVLETLESDMKLVGTIGGRVVSEGLRLMKADADLAAGAVRAAAGSELWPEKGEEAGARLRAVLQEQAQKYGWLSLSIMDGQGRGADVGSFSPGREFIDSAYGRRTSAGERIVTTTEFAADGTLLVRICAPLDVGILVATLPAKVLSSFVSDLRVWNTGSIFLIDRDGSSIANINAARYMTRHRFIDEDQTNPEIRQSADFFRKIMKGEPGVGRYKMLGVDRICVYLPVENSDGWMLGASAPIAESPVYENITLLIMSTLLFLGLGIIAAVFASKVIARAFLRIEAQNSSLMVLNEQVNQASRAKGDFLANMSHEMRTPLNAVIGMTSIGKSAKDMDRKNYCLNKIEEASTHLLGVINDILDMSKIEAGKFELSDVEFNFEKLLQRVTNVIALRVDEKRQDFQVRIDAKIPATLIGDDQRLAQVLANLLSNAVKFTPEQGRVSLNAYLDSYQDDFCTIRIEVRDSGIGISPEQKFRLFSAFEQAESNTTRKFGGTGLGLAISKRIVEMMGGQIQVESELDQGSAFIFTIRVRKGEEKLSGLLRSGVNWGNMHVLVVDDSPDVREYFVELGKRFGVVFDTAADGEAALALFEKNSYDLYFIDWKMPGMDGIELAKRIHAREADKFVIIMISAGEWSSVEDQAKAAGVNKFLSKPLFPSVIVDCINECLGFDNLLAGQETQTGEQNCFADRCILLTEDIAINREIVLSLLEPTGVRVDCAENGVEAVRLFSAQPEAYSLILMDVQMPEMDGYEATRRIRAMDVPNAAEIPIVAMTANVFREDIEKCLAAGMNDHVGKPLDCEELFAKLRRYLPPVPETGEGRSALVAPGPIH
ncbi:MAG: response regulator [Desulfovibrio sp.]|nr:response regulator [Desulfovibrio sp.]